MSPLTDFEVLKKLLQYRVMLTDGGREHYLLSVESGPASDSKLILRSEWDTPVAAQAMRRMLFIIEALLAMEPEPEGWKP